MFNCKFILSALLFFLMVLRPALANINFGIRACQNQWQKTWITTIAPEVVFSKKWFMVGTDATFGTLTPNRTEHVKIIQIRASVVPMLKLPVFKPLFIGIGYGFSAMFGHEEIQDKNNAIIKDSFIDYFGEARAILGLEIPIFNQTFLILKGGYNYLEKNNQYFSVSLGIGFLPQNWQNTILSDIPVRKKSSFHSTAPSSPQVIGEPILENSIGIEENIEQNVSEIPVQTRRKSPARTTITIVKVKDDMNGELNRRLEQSFIRNGYKILSWEKLYSVYSLNISSLKSQNNNIKTLDIFKIRKKETDNVMIALSAANFVELDWILDTKLRYVYENYGNEITITEALARLIHSDTGEVVWTYESGNAESTLSKCSDALSKSLLKALKKLK